MACAPVFPLSARCRREAASAENRCAADAAGQAAAATTGQAGSAGRAGSAVERSPGGNLRSCAHVRTGAGGLAALHDGMRAGFHAPMDRKQKFRRTAVGPMNGEAPAELLAFGAQ